MKYKILERNELGTGILIENDSHITFEHNKHLVEAFNTEFKIVEPLFVYAVLQKYDTENKNGRWYPKELLEREVEKYKQLIKDGNAIGQLDHPECMREDHEVLTQKGWKFIKDVEKNDRLLTYNINTQQSEFKNIKRIIAKHYEGFMYHFHSRFLDKVVTPNHKFLLKDRYDKKYLYREAEDLYLNGEKREKVFKTAQHNSCEAKQETVFVLKGQKTKNWSAEVRRMYEQDISVNTEDWFAFIGLYLAEGFVRTNSYGVCIIQNEGEKATQIQELFNRLPFKYSLTKHKKKLSFTIYDARLWHFMSKLGNKYTKFLPKDLLTWHPRYLQILLTWFQLGDGRKIINKKTKKIIKQSIFSVSHQLMKDLLNCMILCGMNGQITAYQHKDRIIYDEIEKEVETDEGLVLEKVKVKRLIKGINSKSMYNINFNTSTKTTLKQIKIDKLWHSGMIYCFEMEDNNNFFIMRNGKACFTGNSSVIDLKPQTGGASHQIVDMWWEGKTLMGKLELILSPGFVKSGICSVPGDVAANLLRKKVLIGISSRGVGTLKREGGKNTVQDDFELICFDLVSSPSTPGAYINAQQNVLSKFVENEKSIKPLIKPLSKKLDKFLL